MRKTRVIPMVLLDEEKCVKTLKFRSKEYIGDPVNTVRIFSEKCVDEIAILDITSRSKNPPNFALLERIVDEAFMPVGYGGRISTFKQAEQVFNLGVEKVILGWHGPDTVGLVKEISEVFGRQAVAVCLDYSDSAISRSRLFLKGRLVLPIAEIKNIVEIVCLAGAGEVLLQSVDRDGTLTGLDIPIIEKISGSLDVQLVVIGGCNSLDNARLATLAGANAIAAGSLFVFRVPSRAVLINYPSLDELDQVLI